jgi:hypothetical protein
MFLRNVGVRLQVYIESQRDKTPWTTSGGVSLICINFNDINDDSELKGILANNNNNIRMQMYEEHYHVSTCVPSILYPEKNI